MGNAKARGKRPTKHSRRYMDNEATKQAAFDQAKEAIGEEVKEWLLKYDVDGSKSFDREEMTSLLTKLQREVELQMRADAAQVDASSAAPLVPDGAEPEDPQIVQDYLEVVVRQEKERNAKKIGAGDLLKGEEAPPAAAEPAVPAERVYEYALTFRALVQKQKQIQKLFADADTDHNGVLDKEELQALLQKGAPPGYVVSDADATSVFAKVDHNASGAIEKTELESAIAAWMELVTSRAVKELPAEPAKSSTCAIL